MYVREASCAPLGRGAAAMVVAGVMFLVLLAGFVVLYVNVPDGYNSPYGLAPHSVVLFRALWPYPEVQLSPDAFRTLSLSTLGALWIVYLVAAVVLDRWHSPDKQRLAVFIVLGFALLYDLALAVVLPPVLSADVYHY